MKLKLFLAILAAVLISTGAILRFYNYEIGCIMLFVAALYLCLYYTVKSCIEIKNKSNHRFILLFQLILALMSVVICGKYIYFSFGYVLGLVVVPVFLLTTLFYWIKTKKKTVDLTVLSIIYSLLCIPMFANFYDAPFNSYYKYFYPQQYIKYNEIDIKKGVDFYGFWHGYQTQKYDEMITELATQAHILSVYEESYEEASEIYRQIVEIESPPNAYMHYKLADCYFNTGQYEPAISALDIAIRIEPTKAIYYNLRGFMFYLLKEKEPALKDAEKALQLDSEEGITYINLALIYFYLYKDPQKAYEAFKKAEIYNYEFACKYLNVKQEIEEKLAQK